MGYIRCFLKEESILEINDLSKEGLVSNKEINIYGKIILLLNFLSNNHNKNKEKILYQLNYWIIVYFHMIMELIKLIHYLMIQ